MIRIMKRFIILTSVFLILLLVFALYWGWNDDKSEYTVKIGVVLPLTGVSAELGKPIQESMKLAEKYVNEQLGKNGKPKIELLFEDGKSTATGSMAAFHNLKLQKPSAFVIFGDEPCSQLAASVSQYDYPVIALAAAADNIPLLSDKYFRAWTTSKVAGKELANFIKNKLNVENCAILSVNNNYGDEFYKSVLRAIQDIGGKVIIHETYDLANKDVKLQIQKIINTNPDVVIILGYGAGYISAFNQLRTLSYNGPILTDETITIPEYCQAVKNALIETYFSSTTFDPYDTNTDYYKTFVKPFKMDIGTLPNAHSVFGFVCVTMLANAIERCGTDAGSIEKGLLSMQDFESIIGKMSYLPNRELNVEVIVRKINPDGTY